MLRKFLLSAICVVCMFFATSQAFAAGAGAYRVEMTDARALGMGGAFVSVADSPAAVFYNQAGMTQVKGAAASMSMALIQPKVNVKTDAGAKTKMQRDSFLIPSLAVVSAINDKVSFGVGATSSWGLGTEWAQDSFAKYAVTKTSIQNYDYLLSLAYKATEQFSFGVGLVVDDSKVTKEKKLNQVLGGSPDGNYKLSGENAAVGFQISGMYSLNEKHQFGAQYSSSIRRKYKGKTYLDGLNVAYWNTALGGPAFTSSSYSTDIEENYTLPQSIDLGYTYKPTDKLTLSADVLWMDWSCVKKEELVYPTETNPYTLAFLNDGNPANRDWHSAISFAAGTEYKATERLRLRGGYYFHQSPVPQATWDPSLPDASSHSVSTGFGYDITKALTFDLAYSAMFYNTRYVNNEVGNSAGASIDGKYSQWINLVLATVSYKF